MDHVNVGEADSSATSRESPLTRGQAALWFHYKLAPQSVAYNLAWAVAVPLNTDLGALQRAFQRVADRHAALRASFSADHGSPVQRISSATASAFSVEDASTWDAVRLDARLAEEVYRPFDLERGPVWRVIVYRNVETMADGDPNASLREHLVLLVLHHIVADLWSVALIMSEVAALYHEGTTGTPAHLRPLRATYLDHVRQEAARLAGPEVEKAWEYWRAALADELPPLDLPTDRLRRLERTGRGGVYSLPFEGKYVDGLRALANRYHVPLHELLLTAFMVLLHRYTGQDDVLVGFPRASRSVSTARVVGYFVNQTVVRVDLSDDPRFVDVLRDVETQLKTGADHAWYPFSLLVQRLQPDRDPGRAPLIQAVFSWQRAPRIIPGEDVGPFILGEERQTLVLEDLHMRSVHLRHRVAPFDLTVLATEAPDGLAVAFEYATDLFDEETIARMAASYRVLLESIVMQPKACVSCLTILPESERVRLVETWNATVAPYPTPACLHQLFEQQAERTPEVTAVVDAEVQVNYRQLDTRVNRLAHLLRERGVGPDSVVAVYLEPSVQMVMAVLGILKTGGAYLPLDPANPRERLAFMLADARPALLITRQGLRLRLPDEARPLLLMDGENDEWQPQPPPHIGTPTPDHLAYVIYTSGSTGQPKGAALTHRGVVSLLADFQRRRAIRPGDGCSWWTSPGFDVSVYEIFSPLLAGGTLHVIPNRLRLDVDGLLDWLHDHRIRSAYLPPFFLEELAAWIEHHPGVSTLRRLLVGVEPIPHTLLARIAAQVPSLSIINGYGPTETTICSMLYDVTTSPPRPGNTPIGKPVANTQIYLLDRALQPVPVGVVGELYIGGTGLAREYLNRHELTAQRFVPSPFKRGERLYRTGDLARYLSDGNLVFVGRADTQVKLHGVRIELGEIEATLVQHPEVERAVVLLHEQPSGIKHLLGYVTTSQGVPLSPEDLRRFLRQRLPRAMVPSSFVVLDAFPLTQSGKVDRRALRMPEALQPILRKDSPAPRTEVERTLASIWQQVLHVDDVGVGDNFFELGGDSIGGLQIVARAAEAGIHLRPRHIFEAPTVAGLAALADTVEPVRASTDEEGSGGAIPLTPIQRWFFEQDIPNPHHWNQSLLFVTSRPLDSEHLRAAVSALIAQHEALRLRYVKGTSGWQQVAAEAGASVPVEVVDLSTLPEAEQAAAVESHAADQQRSLDLSAGLVIRVVHYVLGADVPGRLLIVAHHLVVDGVSWRILLEDLEMAYRQHSDGRAIRLLPRTTPFSAWARRLAAFARSADVMEEAKVWLQVLEEDRSTSDQHHIEREARHVSRALDAEGTEALLREVPVAYGTEISDILLTALARAFRSWRGIDPLWVDLEGHGREDLFDDVDLTRTVGWFASLYPVRLDLPHADEPGLAIKAIKEQLRAVPHHGLSYGLLRYMNQDPDLTVRFRAVPPALVSFNYLGQLPGARPDSLIAGWAPESPGPQRCPEARRSHLIEIDASIFRGKLYVDWTYTPDVHSHHAIQRVAETFIDEIRALIDHCRSTGVVGYTPSDFPNGGLSQGEIDTLVQGLRRPIGADPTASRRILEAIYPLSPMQEGMVFHTLYTPDSGIYFEQAVLTIRGQLDIRAFEGAWQYVVERYAVLRTSFVWHGLGRARQVVHRDVEVSLALQDWRDVAADGQQLRLDQLLAMERRQGFDLSVPPLLRLMLIRIAADAYELVLNHHHALLDGWSTSLLLDEVFRIYDAIAHGESPSLTPVRPYQDHITWLQAQDLTAAEAFWRAEFAGYVPTALDPTVSESLPLRGASRPAERATSLSTATTSALQALARREHLTINTLAQGAWAMLLGHGLGRDDVVFGVTVSGRHPEVPEMMTAVGLFINTLPLRVHLDSRVYLVEWLRHIQEKAFEIQQYDVTPLTQIRRWSGASQSSVLFDTLLVFENYPVQIGADGRFGGLRIGTTRSIEQTTYPLTIAFTLGEQLGVRVLYDPARFEPDMIERLLSQLRHVFERMIAHPDQTLKAFSAGMPFGREGGQARWAGGGEDPLYSQGDRHSGGELGVPMEATDRRLEVYLARQWKELLKVERVEAHDSFFQLGGDSLRGAVCTYKLQETLHESIPIEAIFEAPTISEYAAYLTRNHSAGVARLLGTPVVPSTQLEARSGPATLVPIQPRGSHPPLFCIHPAGGIVFPYYALAAHLSQDQPMYGLRDPSLFDGNRPADSVEAMAAAYLSALKTVQPEGPYYLLGWSVGGVVAYEMAQQLARQGDRLAALILLDTPAPAASRLSSPQADSGDSMAWLISRFKGLSDHVRGVASAIRPIASYVRSGLFLLAASRRRGDESPGKKPGIRDLLGWARLDSWRARLLRAEPEVATTVSREESLLLIQMPAVQRILALVREHGRLARRYEPPPYPGQITLFRAIRSDTDRHLAADPTLGWDALAERGVDVRPIQANHVALLVQPHVATLARELTIYLDDVLQKSSASLRDGGAVRETGGSTAR